MIEFAKPVNKLWPGAHERCVKERLNKFLNLGDKKYIEQPAVDLEQNYSTFRNLFKFRYGRFKGLVLEAIFVERAFRDQLPAVTRFGNVWQVIRYLLVLVSICSIIIFSGGLNENLRMIDIIEVVGLWTLIEFGFSKAILASNRFINARERLGINLRVIVVASFLSLWVEFLILIIFCNFIDILTNSSFFGVKDILNLLIGVILLMNIFLPIAYLVSKYSVRMTDARFLVGPIFRIFVIITPVFQPYHSEFHLLSQVLDFIPTNLAFYKILGNVHGSTTIVAIYILTVLLLSTLWSIQEKIERRSIWVEVPS